MKLASDSGVGYGANLVQNRAFYTLIIIYGDWGLLVLCQLDQSRQTKAQKMSLSTLNLKGATVCTEYVQPVELCN